tara:strand:- start:22 stop:252 length:231 start_codon:yes stop_codon:yes gene_type:complete
LHASNLFYYRDIASMLSMMRHPHEASSTDADTSPNAPELRRSAKARRGTHDGGILYRYAFFVVKKSRQKKMGKKYS